MAHLGYGMAAGDMEPLITDGGGTTLGDGTVGIVGTTGDGADMVTDGPVMAGEASTTGIAHQGTLVVLAAMEMPSMDTTTEAMPIAEAEEDIMTTIPLRIQTLEVP